MANERLYRYNGPVSSETIVTWFLTLPNVTAWFTDQDNAFYGLRAEAETYLNFWVETGFMQPVSNVTEIPDTITDKDVYRMRVEKLNAYLKYKFEEWLQSWEPYETTNTASA